LSAYITDKYVLRLLWQYLKRTVCFGENYCDVTKGISLGCPLSPLMAALFLKPLDDAIQGSGLFYARFMDDWIVIASTRWKLRKAVKQVNAILNRLLLKKHPDKTFIGKAERGFDFPGYFFRPGLLSVAKKTVSKLFFGFK
jgi:RNA-directed DNA polymerase